MCLSYRCVHMLSSVLMSLRVTRMAWGLHMIAFVSVTMPFCVSVLHSLRCSSVLLLRFQVHRSFLSFVSRSLSRPWGRTKTNRRIKEKREKQPQKSPPQHTVPKDVRERKRQEQVSEIKNKG